MNRRTCRTVMVGGVPMGGDAPITVQSMLNIPAHDRKGNVEQAKRLRDAGCEILRVAVPDASGAYRRRDQGGGVAAAGGGYPF